ncbi:MAG: hypothetical protein MR630_11690, partial [Selenomonas sp.]|uniref:hypothetical protein n=1 Tax=Selenomonas sp. TaxID=2053611 RepID=UPI0025D34CA1
GTVSEEFACPLDDRSTRAEVCMNEVFYPLHADFSRHAGCFPCAKFEILIVYVFLSIIKIRK